MAEIQPAEERRRAEILETLARKHYDSRVPRSAPDWDDAPAMVRYTVMESVNDIVNEVLEHFTPMSPDHGALVMRMELLAAEVEGLEADTPGCLMEPRQVATAIRRTIAEGSEYGRVKE